MRKLTLIFSIITLTILYCISYFILSQHLVSFIVNITNFIIIMNCLYMLNNSLDDLIATSIASSFGFNFE